MSIVPIYFRAVSSNLIQRVNRGDCTILCDSDSVFLLAIIIPNPILPSTTHWHVPVHPQPTTAHIMSPRGPTSTPPKSQSHQTQGSSEVLQNELKKKMGDEISNQVYQFPPERIAEMLRPSGTELPLDDAINSLNKTLRDASDRASIPSGRERATYEAVVFILNSCVNSCVEVIRKVGKNSTTRWFEGLQFIVWDREMADGIDGAEKLKPDGGGLNNPPPILRNVKLYWRIVREDDTNRRLLLPLEIKGADRELVKQAATYARGLNSAIPFRAFELVLTYNHASDQFRFLIFHRGGLTCSKPIKLCSRTKKSYNPPDCTDLVRMFMSILSWTRADDAGCPSFSNGKQLSLPHPLEPNTTLRFTTDVVLYQRLGIRSRNTWVARLKTYTNDASHAAKVVDLPRGQRPNDEPTSAGSSRPRPPRKVASKFKFTKVFKSGQSSGKNTETLKRKEPDETPDLGT